MPRTLFSTLMLPSEGVYQSKLPHLNSLPVRTFLPTGYEANYAYPLVVLFHPHGGSDEQVLRLAPRISRRNAIYVSLRGPVPLNLTDADGASVAYRLALQRPGQFAGVVSINGTLPRPAEGPLFRDDEVKDLRVLIAHGAANEVVPLEMARRDFLALYGAGADVLLSTYPCTHTVHPNMLRDINRWVIRNVDHDACWDAEDDEFED